jgi:hypothetical protein
MFDEGDEAMVIRLRDMMMATDRPSPTHDETFPGLGHIVSDVLYLISSVWTEFFVEAELHLHVLVGPNVISSMGDPTVNRNRALNASAKI